MARTLSKYEQFIHDVQCKADTPKQKIDASIVSRVINIALRRIREMPVKDFMALKPKHK